MDFDITCELDDESLQLLYAWVDGIPLSRKKKNITRDFSDGVLVAEILKFYFPKLVDLHNYYSANSLKQKLCNWNILCRKILPRIDYYVPIDVPQKIAECLPGVLEVFLFGLMQKIQAHHIKHKNQKSIMPNQVKLRYKSEPAVNLDTTGHSHRVAKGPASQQEKKLSSLPPLNVAQLDSQARLLVEEREQVISDLQETVQMLEAKIHRLENILHLKDLRLQDIQQHSVTGEASLSQVALINQKEQV